MTWHKHLFSLMSKTSTVGHDYTLFNGKGWLILLHRVDAITSDTVADLFIGLRWSWCVCSQRWGVHFSGTRDRPAFDRKWCTNEVAYTVDAMQKYKSVFTASNHWPKSPSVTKGFICWFVMNVLLPLKKYLHKIKDQTGSVSLYFF